jgi:26S proteasome regulatory subunit N9
MNQFSLVQIAIVCAKEFSPKDAPEALRFMAEVAKDVEAEDLESFVLAKSECAHYHLLLGQAGEAEEILSQCQRHLDSFSYSVDQVTFASYYRHCSDLYKAKADYKSYYKNSLMFLSCVSIDELSQQEKEQRAYDLSIAALLSPLYNFGELLLHPILDSLLKTRNEWIRTLLVQFNEGKVKGLEFSVLKNDQLLVQNTEFLKQKLCIMCLIELIFQKSAETKNIK